MKPDAMGVVALLVLSALAGCASTLKENFYALSPGVAGSPAQTAPRYTVAVGPVTVPDIVDRPQMVLSVAANRVKLDEQSRWAEPLKSGIPRVVAGNLARLLGGAQVYAYPQNAGSDADYRVSLDVQRFESAPGDAVTIEVSWVVRISGDSGTRKGGFSVIREAAGGSDLAALVAAHDRALAALSREIAAAIREFGKLPD